MDSDLLHCGYFDERPDYEREKLMRNWISVYRRCEHWHRAYSAPTVLAGEMTYIKAGSLFDSRSGRVTRDAVDCRERTTK